MPFEVTFNMKPNFGSAKSFVEVNDKNVETSVSDAPCCSHKISDLTVIEETEESPSDDEPNSMLERQKAADAMREQLNQNKISNAEKLIKKHDCKRNKKTRFFKEGDRVTVKIPRIDRGSADLTRLPGVIGKVSEHKETFYTVLTSFGTLQDSYRASDLEPYSGLVSVNINDLYSKMIALHTAANLQAVRTGSVEEVNAVCNCTGKCSDDKRCSCFKINKKCTSHCHNKGKAAKTKRICTNC